TANAADIEIVLVIHDLMRALGLERFQIHVNNRLLLNGLLEEMGLADHAGAILRVLDKLKKDRDATFQEMAALSAVGASRAEAIISLAETKGSNRDILDQLQGRHGENPRASEGIRRLRELL